MGNYAVNADVTGYKVNGSTVSLSSYTAGEITAAISLAESLVERVTNDIFYSKTETNYFDGTGFAKLFFTPKVPYRIISPSSVTEVDADGSTVLHTFTANQDFFVNPFWLEMFTGQNMRPRVMVGSGGLWPLGQRNIKVAGTWGASSVPAEIKEATILLTLERLVPNSTKMTPKDIKSGKWPDFEVVFRVADNQVSLTGYPEIDRLLERYINYSDLFNVVPVTRYMFDN